MHQPLSLHHSLLLCILYLIETYDDFIINQNVSHILTYIRSTKDCCVVFIGHFKWLQICLADSHVEYIPNFYKNIKKKIQRENCVE